MPPRTLEAAWALDKGIWQRVIPFRAISCV